MTTLYTVRFTSYNEYGGTSYSNHPYNFVSRKCAAAFANLIAEKHYDDCSIIPSNNPAEPVSAPPALVDLFDEIPF